MTGVQDLQEEVRSLEAIVGELRAEQSALRAALAKTPRASRGFVRAMLLGAIVGAGVSPLIVWGYIAFVVGRALGSGNPY